MQSSITLSDRTKPLTLAVKDPLSALTHLIAALGAALAGPFLIRHYMDAGADGLQIFGALIFVFSMLLLYTASTTYHTVVYAGRNNIFKKLDHMSIFVLIAGTYTPLCLTVLRDTCGPAFLAAIWGLAGVGILFKFCWVTCPRWVSSVIYITMGWLCLFIFPQLFHSLSLTGFLLILSGGIVYTLGGIIYAMKFSFFNSRHPYFGSHEIFHLFVMVGNLLHFIAIYACLV